MVVLLVVICLCMTALVVRLFWLQVLQNKYYKACAVENSTRVTFLRAPRGIIYDRHGNLLATNKQTLSMVAIPNQIEHLSDLFPTLQSSRSTSAKKVHAQLMKAKASHSVLPYVIEHDVDMKMVSNFYENRLFSSRHRYSLRRFTQLSSWRVECAHTLDIAVKSPQLNWKRALKDGWETWLGKMEWSVCMMSSCAV